MKLFEIDEAFQVQLNKEWIMLIPEFKELLLRDKGSEGDYRGTKKYRARKEFAYIYFMTDFHSPIRDYPDEDKEKEALRYVGLDKKDIDDKILKALEHYQYMQYQNAPSLRTLEAVKSGQEAMDDWFRNVDFSIVDKMGRARYTAKDYQENIKNLPKTRAAIKEFERMVEEELRENTGIRGKAKLGGQEGKRREKIWEEGGDPDEIDTPETVEI